MGGGVAANCVGIGIGIGRIVEEGIFEEVFVPPAPGDSGTAIGAPPPSTWPPPHNC